MTHQFSMLAEFFGSTGSFFRVLPPGLAHFPSAGRRNAQIARLLHGSVESSENQKQTNQSS